MKIPYSFNREQFHRDLLEMNGKQVRAVRHEAEQVKNCFTNQAHQAMVASATIAGVMAAVLKGSFDPYVIAVGASLIAALCLTVARVGCYKYGTANRVSAFQIHLARIVDYHEATDDADHVAIELRRIDWEEAMYAWRVVQPKIFHFCYIELESLGLCLKRNELIRRFAKYRWQAIRWSKKYLRIVRKPLVAIAVRTRQPYRVMQAQALKDYPWFDTADLIKAYCRQPAAGAQERASRETVASTTRTSQKAAGRCKTERISESNPRIHYHPGTYLRKKLRQLHGIMLLATVILGYCLWRISDGIGQFNSASPSERIVQLFFIVVGIYLAAVFSRGYFGNRSRSRVLESGLLSIQTSAFVWRAVCVCHLLAKKARHETVTKEQSEHPQIYDGYTVELHRCAISLRNNLHQIHDWLRDGEVELEAFYKRLYTHNDP